MSVSTSSLKKIHVLVNFNVGCCSLVEAVLPRLSGLEPGDCQIFESLLWNVSSSQDCCI